ncbi:TPA: hypothetical protein ACH3X1_011295 [Trebouxia sp. C0004]
MEQLGTNAATRITEALEIDQRHCTHPAKISTTSGKASGGACSTGSFQSNLCQLVQSHLQAVLQARWLSASARRVMELLQCQKDNTLLFANYVAAFKTTVKSHQDSRRQIKIGISSWVQSRLG